MSNPSGDSTITGLPSAVTLTGLEWLVMDQIQNGIATTVRCSVAQLIAQGFGANGSVGQVLTITAPGIATFSNSPTIIGGTINNTPIGATTKNTGAFTTLSSSAGVSITAGGISVVGGMTLSGGISADTVALSNPLPVTSGGTGRASLTNHAVLVGAATGAVTQLGTGTAGQSLISQGAAADPVFGQPTGTLIGVQVINSTQTYTPTPGTNSVIVEIWGGGGAGGGAPATGAGQVSTGAGGGGGGYGKSRLTSGFSGVTVTIGAAGTGNSGAAGGNGGNSTFGALITAGGGSGGGINGPAATVNAAGGLGGTTTGANVVNAQGWKAGASSYSTAGPVVGALGANSTIGSGGLYTASGTGGAAGNFAAGGGGTFQNASSGALTGGSAGPGLCIIHEYA